MGKSTASISNKPSEFKQLEEPRDFTVYQILALFTPVSRIKDAMILEELGDSESLAVNYHKTSGLYIVRLECRKEPVKTPVDNRSLLGVIARELILGGTYFSVQRNMYQPYCSIRQALRDRSGHPVTEHSDKLRRWDRLYSRIQTGLYDFIS